MADTTHLASLSLTHVHYDPTDPVSYFCAWLALVPQGLCVVYVTLIWSTREAEVLLMFAGQLACEALNFALKRFIKEERPRMMHGKGYGMPSSHAQFVAYFSTALTLFLLLRHAPIAPAAAGATTTITTATATTDARRARAHAPLSLVARAALAAAALGNAALVAWSRLYLSYHTEKQVLVGCAAGVASALAWFVATALLRRSGLLLWALGTRPARLLRMRDLVVEEDLCQAGWEKWESRSRGPREGPRRGAGGRGEEVDARTAKLKSW